MPSQPRGIKEGLYPKDTLKHNQDDLQGGRLVLHRWNRSPPSNLLSFHQPRKCGNGSVQISTSIRRTGVSQCYLCLRNNKCPICGRVPVCRLHHPQQFHDFCFSQARAKFRQSPARLSYLPTDSSRRTKEIFRRNQSIIEAIGSRTFRFQQTWNPNTTIWSSLDNLFGKNSVCTLSLNQLSTMISRNKKSFQDQIMLDKCFASKFLFAINKQV